ncbi:hypothetical protein P7C70_g218, partial [Phenoliferia sp. Uapishka_3]
MLTASVSTVPTPVALVITVNQFASFATPAITVPFPSVYAQTQIPFAYPATPTFAATRIPTTIGGVAATSGISSALKATGVTYGQSGNESSTGAGAGWPLWATIVIVACGVIFIILASLAIFCFLTRHKRAEKRNNRRAVKANGRRSRSQSGKASGAEFAEKSAAVGQKAGRTARPSTRQTKASRGVALAPSENPFRNTSQSTIPTITKNPPANVRRSSSRPTSRSRSRSRSPNPNTRRNVPYPPYPSAPRDPSPSQYSHDNHSRSIHQRNDIAYANPQPLPLDSSDDGYSTPTDYEHGGPAYTTDTDQDSPARIWNPPLQQDHYQQQQNTIPSHQQQQPREALPQHDWNRNSRQFQSNQGEGEGLLYPAGDVRNRTDDRRRNSSHVSPTLVAQEWGQQEQGRQQDRRTRPASSQVPMAGGWERGGREERTASREPMRPSSRVQSMEPIRPERRVMREDYGEREDGRPSGRAERLEPAWVNQKTGR